MHISESKPPPNTILTKCTKMTEEGHRRHGMNGNVDRTIKEECPKSSYGQGGRLKFFKDGKFILELERAREGERVSWVSVPRKTFWPPAGTAPSTSVYRQESCTSLSVSDDNSSIQSSPWQRDHSWKQTTPRKGISRELAMYFWRPRVRRLRARCGRKRRRPLSAGADYLQNGAAALDKTIKREKRERKSLLTIVQTLIDKNFRTSSTTPPRSETVVSPRKRFLREMERDRVQAEDLNAQKRSRSKPATSTSATSSTSAGQSSGSSMSPPSAVGSPVRNGQEDKKPPQRNCSYSITSLLAEDRNMKRSPSSSPSQYTPVVGPAQYCSPSSEDRWYSESVDRLRSIELSQVDKCACPPYLPPQSYFGSYMYPFSPVPPYYAAGGYGRGYVMPSVYHSGPVPAAPLRHDTPSCSWNPAMPRDVPDGREESIADMPLNLSKNSG